MKPGQACHNCGVTLLEIREETYQSLVNLMKRLAEDYGLGGWRLEFSATKLPSDVLVEIDRNADARSAYIKVNTECAIPNDWPCPGWDYLEYIAEHEILHVVLAEYNDASTWHNMAVDTKKAMIKGIEHSVIHCILKRLNKLKSSYET